MTFLKALRRGVHHIGHLKPARLIHDVKHVINEVKNEYSKGKQWAINHGGLPVKNIITAIEKSPIGVAVGGAVQAAEATVDQADLIRQNANALKRAGDNLWKDGKPLAKKLRSDIKSGNVQGAIATTDNMGRLVREQAPGIYQAGRTLRDSAVVPPPLQSFVNSTF